MARPLIGIPCFVAERAGTHRLIVGNNQAYVHAVEQAGGIPLLIPPFTDAETLGSVCAQLGGLLLTGGTDIDPALYGETARPECGEVEVERDSAEVAVTKFALASHLPVLGVCRGLQLLNVMHGGSLYQDLRTQRPDVMRHDELSHPRSYRSHAVRLADGSRLASIMGTTALDVNSLHHQAINRIGSGIAVVGRSPDGVAEAIELVGQPFALAVQYHPEELYDSDEASQRLFHAFIEASARH